MLLRTLCLLYCLPLALLAQPGPQLPLKTSADGRYFQDQAGQPFLYQADTGWQLFARLTLPEAREYLTLRQRQGFTAVQVMFSMNPDSANRAGQRPFLNFDFGQPNDTYFAHAGRVIQLADSLGLLVNVSPFWIGCCGEGFGVGGVHELYKQAGPIKTRALGQYLGKRFGGFKNLIWTMGGDNDPRSIRAEIVALAEGLHAAAPGQLMTFHASPPHSSTDLFQYANWLSFSMIYTYWREKPNPWVDPQQMPHVYEAALREYNKSDRLPFVLGESQYEGSGKRYDNDIGTAQHVRRQAWWTMLCGGAGHAYGHDGWNFPPDWRAIMQYPGGSQHLGQLSALLRQVAWQTLRPDQRHEIVVEGYGQYGRADYVAAAITDDGQTLLAYLPQPGRVLVDLSKFKAARLSVRWYDPRTGAFGPAETVPNAGLKRFTSPPQDDWVLVVMNAI
jgi:hypothetical protein